MSAKAMEVGAHGFTYSVVAQDLYDPMDREQKWYSDAATAHILVNQQRVALCGAESGAPGCYAGYVWHYLTTDDPRPVCKRCIAALRKVGTFAEELERHNEEGVL